MEERLYKVKYSSLILSFLCLLLISLPHLGQRINNIIKLNLEIILILLVAIKYKFTTDALKKCVYICSLFIAMCLSTFFYYGISSRFLNTMITAGAYILFYLIIALFSKKYSYEYVMAIINKNIIIYMLILDIFVILTLGFGLRGRGIGGIIDESVYLLGNKFITSYIHMLVLAFVNQQRYRVLSKRTKIYRIVILLLYSLIICKLMDTTTGMIGCILVATIQTIITYKPRFIHFLSHPLVVLIFFFSINIIFLLTDFVLNNDFFTSFLLSKSHTSTILSGRVAMYNISMEAIAKNPIWGYGINYDIVRTTLSFGNAQNGLLKMLMDYGVIGTIMFTLVLFTTFKNAYKTNDNNRKAGSIAFIYAMLFCSLVEINLTSIFMLICAFLNSMSSVNNKMICFTKNN